MTIVKSRLTDEKISMHSVIFILWCLFSMIGGISSKARDLILKSGSRLIIIEYDPGNAVGNEIEQKL